MLIALVVLLIGALVQSSVLPWVGFGSHAPDVVLLLVAGWAMLRDVEEGMIWGLIGGICLDLFSAGPFGAGMLALGIVGIVAATIGNPLRKRHDFLPLIATAALTALYYLILGVTMSTLLWQVEWSSAFTMVIAPAALLNTIGMVPTLALLRFVDALLPGAWNAPTLGVSGGTRGIPTRPGWRM